MVSQLQSLINLIMGAIILSLPVASAKKSSPNTCARFFRYCGMLVALLRVNMGLEGSGLIGNLPRPLFEISSVWVAIVWVLLWFADICFGFIWGSFSFWYLLIKSIVAWSVASSNVNLTLGIDWIFCIDRICRDWFFWICKFWIMFICMFWR